LFYDYSGSESDDNMGWRAVRISALVGVPVLALMGWLIVQKPLSHRIVIKAYFTDAMGLRTGAVVRLAGVDVGSVKSVRARPEMKEVPAEVVMVLTPSYELKIPNDATASLATAGVLGDTYVAIDASHASGPPIGTSGVLEARRTTELSTQEILQKLGDIMSKRCDCDSSSHAAVGKKISSKPAY